MAESGTYEQHVFGLELRDKFLGPLAKTVRVLEQASTAWDKFEARVRGGGMDKAMSKVNGLIARYEQLEKVINRISAPRMGGGGIGSSRGGGSVLDSHAERRKYEVWWDQQLKKQESASQRAATREAAAAQRIAAQEARALQRKDDAATRAAQRASKQSVQEMKPFADMWAKIGTKMYVDQLKEAKKKSEEIKKDFETIGNSLTSALGLLKSGLFSIVDRGFDFGKSIVKTLAEAARDRELLMTALKIQLGSEEKANAQLNKTLRIAQLTPASNLQVTDLTKRLLGQQFTGRRLDAARATWADVQAFGGDKAARQIEFWMSRTAARGEASTAAVSGISKAGISERFIREEMAKQMGKSVGYKDGEAYTDTHDKAVRDAISQRKVSSGTFETAVERAVLRTLKQTELGAYSKKKGRDSLAGVMSNIEEAVPTFLMGDFGKGGIGIESFPGIKELKRFLADILSFFDITTKEGKELAKIIENLTNELFGGLQNITKADMSRFFSEAAGAASELVKVIHSAWDLIGELIRDTSGKGLGGALESAGKIFGTAVGEAIAAMLPSIMQSAAKAIPGAIKGVAVGAVQGAWSVGTDLGHATQNWIQKQIFGSTPGDYSKERFEKHARKPPIEAAVSGPSSSEYGGMSSMPSAPILSAGQADALSALGIPGYADGGVVPGPPGSPQLAVVHGGERYLGVGKRAGGGGDVYIETVIIQCDESALRKNFTEWFVETLDDELAAGASS